ncbi:MAG: tetratricopeptide repeat protein [Bdellovibrionota bacterium]
MDQEKTTRDFVQNLEEKGLFRFPTLLLWFGGGFLFFVLALAMFSSSEDEQKTDSSATSTVLTQEVQDAAEDAQDQDVTGEEETEDFSQETTTDAQTLDAENVSEESTTLSQEETTAPQPEAAVTKVEMVNGRLWITVPEISWEEWEKIQAEKAAQNEDKASEEVSEQEIAQVEVPVQKPTRVSVALPKAKSTTVSLPKDVREILSSNSNHQPTKLSQSLNQLANVDDRYQRHPEVEIFVLEAKSILALRQGKALSNAVAFDPALTLLEKKMNSPERQRAALYAALASRASYNPLWVETLSKQQKDPLAQYAVTLAKHVESKSSLAEQMTDFEKLHANFPDFFPISETLANTYLLSKLPSRAQELYTSLIVLEPTDQSLQTALYRSVDAQNNPQALIELVQQRPQGQDMNWEQHYLYGKALKETGKIDEAVEQFALALADSSLGRASKNRGVIWYEKGQLEFKQQKYKDSATSFYESTTIRKNDVTAWSFLAASYYRDADYGKAIAAYQQALALTPGEKSLEKYLGMSMILSNQVEAGKQHLMASIEKGLRDADSYYFLAKVESTGGNLDLAKTYLTQSLGVDPSYTPAQKLLASLAPQSTTVAP